MARPRILELRIITLGDALVGKSSLLKNYLETLSGTPTDLEVPRTVGVDVVFCPTRIGGEEAHIHFFDLAGGPEYAELRDEFYGWRQSRHGALGSPMTDGALLVFDASDEESFKRLDVWLEACAATRKNHGIPSKLPLVLVGNKCEKGAAVSMREASKWAADHSLSYFEASALTGKSVMEAFTCLLELAARPYVGLPLPTKPS